MNVPSGGLLADHPVARCAGIDDAEESLARVFLPVELAVSDPRRLSLTLNAVRVGRTTVGYLGFDRAFSMVTAEAQDYYVDVPVRGVGRMRSGGGDVHHVGPESGMVFGPGRPARLNCSAEYAQLSLMIPAASVRLAAEALLDRPLAAAPELSEPLDLTTPAGRTLLSTLDLIDRSAARADGPLGHPIAAQHLERVLIDSLLFAQSPAFGAALAAVPAGAGSRTVALATDLLRARPEHPWTVAELAREVATSPRSLHESFRRTLETTPMAFLRRVRLEGARAQLVEADAAVTTIAQVAYRWGFVNAGRFAAEYRARFAELPSQTLRR